MIDIHAHILPIDDGSKDLETSLSMLKKSIEQGITAVILTPHYNSTTKLTIGQTKEYFEEFKQIVKQKDYDVDLYLGQEVYIDRHYKKKIEQHDFLSLNDSKYILIEFDYDTKMDITEVVYELVRLGYKPIIAHAERYENLTLDDAEEIKELGGYIQVNANSVVGLRFGKSKVFAKKLLRKGLVDFIASDVHYFRKNKMKRAKTCVELKYGKGIKDLIFNLNAKKIIEG
jgi:protein-tyrosine phosphatase